MIWNWSFALQITPALIDGLLVTVEVTLLATLAAMFLGLLLAIARLSSAKSVSRPTLQFVEVVRRTPLLVQLYLLFYILPDAGLVLSPFVTGVVGLGVNYAAYISEVFRAGIESVARGQWEAAIACNLSRRRTWQYVILPQAIPPMIPPLANYFIAMFKETPILSVITVMEMMNEARTEANLYYRYLEPMTLVGAFFLLVSLPSAAFTRYLERKLVRGDGQSTGDEQPRIREIRLKSLTRIERERALSHEKGLFDGVVRQRSGEPNRPDTEASVSFKQRNSDDDAVDRRAAP